jgi:hypothetical protein
VLDFTNTYLLCAPPKRRIIKKDYGGAQRFTFWVDLQQKDWKQLLVRTHPQPISVWSSKRRL